MEKKTIGQFIAALRRANGLTQQEVADRLAVSNKAVSRWERDECAPDISVIPALAELLGVTCDELLKGERITTAVQAEKSEPKIEKQVKALMNRTISNFKNMIGISIALSVVGLICMFGISYGFYRPIIGFAVMLLLEAVAVTIAVIAVNKMKANKTDNELFENADKGLMDRYDKCLGNYSFLAYYAVLAVVMLSLPFVLNLSDYYIESVLTFESYLSYLWAIILILAFVFLMAQKPYIEWIINKKLDEAEELEIDAVENKAKLQKMNCLQIGSVVVAGILFIVAPYFEVHNETAPILVGLGVVGLCILVGNIVSFFVFISKDKMARKYLWLSGIRNMLLIPAGLMCGNVHGVVWVYNTHTWTGSDWWDMDQLWLAIAWALLVIVVFRIIEVFVKKHRAS